MRKLIKKLIIKILPDIVYDKDENIKAIRNLNRKLQEEKEESKMWKQRALKTEDFIRNSMMSSKYRAMEYDKKFGTSIYYHYFGSML